MSANPLHDIAIIATHNTRQARHLEGATDMSLIMEAIREVIKKAGITADDISHRLAEMIPADPGELAGKDGFPDVFRAADAH